MHLNHGRYQFLWTWNPLDWSYGSHYWSGALGAIYESSWCSGPLTIRRFKKAPGGGE
jgi:hypothetical protein